LEAAGISTSLEVTSVPDTTPPTITSISFSPQIVDVSSGARDVTITLAIQDDMSGFDFNSYPKGRYFSTFLGVRSPSGQDIYVIYDSLRLVSGTAQDGIFEITVKIPQYAASGEWYISNLYPYDTAGNGRVYYPPNKFTVFSSPSDTTAPELANLAFEPSFINTSDGN
jgi:hypothetical protein